MLRIAVVIGGFVIGGLVCLISAPAGAVDLVNRDGTPHQVILIEAGQPNPFTMAGHSALKRVCTACTVEIDGSGRIDAEDADTVVIRNGTPVIGG